jgi:hypothetical protein
MMSQKMHQTIFASLLVVAKRNLFVSASASTPINRPTSKAINLPTPKREMNTAHCHLPQLLQ